MLYRGQMTEKAFSMKQYTKDIVKSAFIECLLDGHFNDSDITQRLDKFCTVNNIDCKDDKREILKVWLK